MQDVQEKIGQALGRIPSGVFILVAGDGAAAKTGMLASWVQQASFQPAQVTVAVNKSRYLNDWLKAGSPVTLNQVAKGDNSLFRQFGKGFEPDADAFSGVECVPGENGLPVLSSALMSMEGTVSSQMESGDHWIYLITIHHAHSHRDVGSAEAFVHLRKNGFSY